MRVLGALLPSNTCEQAIDAIEALLAREAALRKFILDERESLMASIRGSTHWSGCEKNHRECRRIKELDDALAAIGDVAGEGK